MYRESIDIVSEALKDYNALVMTGDDDISLRKEKMIKFQEYNTNYRIFITQMRVGGVGIDLHDTNGKFPRIALMSSTTFEHNLLIQAEARIFRGGVKSDAIIFYIFGKLEGKEEFVREERIINNLMVKSDVVRYMYQSNEKLPGEYDEIIED